MSEAGSADRDPLDSFQTQVDDLDIRSLEELHLENGPSSFQSTFIGGEIASDFLLSAET